MFWMLQSHHVTITNLAHLVQNFTERGLTTNYHTMVKTHVFLLLKEVLKEALSGTLGGKVHIKTMWSTAIRDLP